MLSETHPHAERNHLPAQHPTRTDTHPQNPTGTVKRPAMQGRRNTLAHSTPTPAIHPLLPQTVQRHGHDNRTPATMTRPDASELVQPANSSSANAATQPTTDATTETGESADLEHDHDATRSSGFFYTQPTGDRAVSHLSPPDLFFHRGVARARER